MKNNKKKNEKRKVSLEKEQNECMKNTQNRAKTKNAFGVVSTFKIPSLTRQSS